MSRKQRYKHVCLAEFGAGNESAGFGSGVGHWAIPVQLLSRFSLTVEGQGTDHGGTKDVSAGSRARQS